VNRHDRTSSQAIRFMWDPAGARAILVIALKEGQTWPAGGSIDNFFDTFGLISLLCWTWEEGIQGTAGKILRGKELHVQILWNKELGVRLGWFAGSNRTYCLGL